MIFYIYKYYKIFDEIILSEENDNLCSSGNSLSGCWVMWGRTRGLYYIFFCQTPKLLTLHHLKMLILHKYIYIDIYYYTNTQIQYKTKLHLFCQLAKFLYLHKLNIT